MEIYPYSQYNLSENHPIVIYLSSSDYTVQTFLFEVRKFGE